MRKRGRGALVVSVVLAAACSLSVPASAADRLFGVTSAARLVSFHSDSPGVFRTRKAITGLVGGDRIVAIGVQPSGGRLYGVSDGSRLYSITARDGKARAIGGPFGPQLGSQEIGFALAPGGRQAQVVTEYGRSFRLDLSTGQRIDGDPMAAGIQDDGDLHYAAGDRGASRDPRVSAAAYARTSARRLFGVDSALDALVVQEPSSGTLRTVAPLGIETSSRVGLDVARSGRAWATLSPRGTDLAALYRVGLGNGRIAPAGSVPVIGLFSRSPDNELHAFAAGGRVPNDRTPPRVRNRKLNDPRVSRLLKGGTLRLEVRCTEACLVSTQLLLGRRIVGGAAGGVAARGRRTVLRLRLTPRGRKLVRRLKPKRLKVAIAATDAAGNVVRTPRFRG